MGRGGCGPPAGQLRVDPLLDLGAGKHVGGLVQRLPSRQRRQRLVQVQHLQQQQGGLQGPAECGARRAHVTTLSSKGRMHGRSCWQPWAAPPLKHCRVREQSPPPRYCSPA